MPVVLAALTNRLTSLFHNRGWRGAPVWRRSIDSGLGGPVGPWGDRLKTYRTDGGHKSVDRGWSLRSTPGYPLGPRWGRLWCGAGGPAVGQDDLQVEDGGLPKSRTACATLLEHRSFAGRLGCVGLWPTSIVLTRAVWHHLRGAGVVGGAGQPGQPLGGPARAAAASLVSENAGGGPLCRLPLWWQTSRSVRLLREHGPIDPPALFTIETD